ncbi:MAG: hypothetical protein PUA84_02500 [Oscillospiraceae bacterium]|nr:hypothetical protein [Oscillospiraceae bacterium]
MKRMNLRLWLTASQRRKLELFAYMVILAAGCTAGMICRIKCGDIFLCRFSEAYGIPGDYNSMAEVFVYSLRWNLSIWLLSMYLGFCAIGQPCLAAVLVLHGFSAGCCLTGFSENMTARMLPGYVLSAVFTVAVSFMLLLGVREAVRLSGMWVKVYFSGTDAPEMRRRLRLYFVRFTVLLVMIISASLLYAVCVSFL